MVITQKRRDKSEKMLKLIEIVCLVKITYITQPSIFWIFESIFLKFLNYLDNLINYPFCFVWIDRITYKLGSERVQNEMNMGDITC